MWSVSSGKRFLFPKTLPFVSSRASRAEPPEEEEDVVHALRDLRAIPARRTEPEWRACLARMRTRVLKPDLVQSDLFNRTAPELLDQRSADPDLRSLGSLQARRLTPPPAQPLTQVAHLRQVLADPLRVLSPLLRSDFRKAPILSTSS
jgi:hypothetical protein